MNKSDIKQRIDGLNTYMLSDSDKQLLLLTILVKIGMLLTIKGALKLGMKLRLL